MPTIDEIQAGDYCPSCAQLIPEEDWSKHEAGRDLERIDCPRQDITLIREEFADAPLLERRRDTL